MQFSISGYNNACGLLDTVMIDPMTMRLLTSPDVCMSSVRITAPSEVDCDIFEYTSMLSETRGVVSEFPRPGRSMFTFSNVHVTTSSSMHARHWKR